MRWRSSTAGGRRISSVKRLRTSWQTTSSGSSRKAGSNDAAWNRRSSRVVRRRRGHRRRSIRRSRRPGESRRLGRARRAGGFRGGPRGIAQSIDLQRRSRVRSRRRKLTGSSTPCVTGRSFATSSRTSTSPRSQAHPNVSSATGRDPDATRTSSEGGWRVRFESPMRGIWLRCPMLELLRFNSRARAHWSTRTWLRSFGCAFVRSRTAGYVLDRGPSMRQLPGRPRPPRACSTGSRHPPRRPNEPRVRGSLRASYRLEAGLEQCAAGRDRLRPHLRFGEGGHDSRT